MTRTSSTMLNMNGMSRYYCLVPNIREKIFSLLSWCMILADFLFLFKIEAVYQVEVIFFFFKLSETLITSCVRFFPTFFLLVRAVSPKWKLWTQLHLGCQTPGESGTLRRVISEGLSQVTVTLCGNPHRHPGKRGVIVHKCLDSHRFVFGLRMLCTNCFSQKWLVSGCQQSYSERPFSRSASFLTHPFQAIFPCGPFLPSCPSCVPAGPSQPASPSKLCQGFLTHSSRTPPQAYRRHFG